MKSQPENAPSWQCRGQSVQSLKTSLFSELTDRTEEQELCVRVNDLGASDLRF